MAFEQYSVGISNGFCADCHGPFRQGGYASLSDGVEWQTSLHDGHRQGMLDLDCDTCHLGGTSPVFLDQSDGGTGFDPIGCIGCHGRAEPEAGGAVTGAGLRQHHDRSGILICRDCHADANPANFTTVGEEVAPPYYFTPDGAHPNKPTDPCDGNGSESAVVPPRGLDNDGDTLYDGDDPDCSPAGANELDVTPTFALHGLLPNPSRGPLSVGLTLPSAEPARLELLDVTGRSVAEREVGALGAGYHVVGLTQRKLAAGLYLLRLTQVGRTVTAKAVVTD
jgi:hypothetical protein